MVPYFATFAIVITIKLLSQKGAYVENPVTAFAYVEMLWSPVAGYFLWFIWALWWMFVISPCFKSRNSRIILLIVATLLHFYPILQSEIFCLSQCQNMLIYFVLGMICWDYQKYITFNKHKLTGLALFCALTIFKYCGITVYGFDEIFSLILAISGIFMIMQVSLWIKDKVASKGSDVLLQSSASSYIIYLFHTTFEGFAKSIIFKIPIFSSNSNDVGFGIGAVIVITCGVIVPVLLHKYVLVKSKYLRVMFGLK